MMKNRVKTTEQAFIYITDCNLATITYMAGLKNKSKNEFERQINIAQQSIDWMVKFGINPAGTRAEDIINKTTVLEWITNIINDIN